MIKAIVFDLGGVIQGLDWSPVVNSILDINEDLDIYKYQAAFLYERKKYFDMYQTNKMGKYKFWRMVAGKLDIEQKYIDRLSQSFELLYSFVNHDLLEFIRTLKGDFQLMVLSNACPELERKVIQDNIYVSLFDKMYFSHNIGCRKPVEESYLRVLEDNALLPNECLFVDNDMINIKGAEKVGMKCILYKSVDSLKLDLYEILKKKG